MHVCIICVYVCIYTHKPKVSCHGDSQCFGESPRSPRRLASLFCWEPRARPRGLLQAITRQPLDIYIYIYIYKTHIYICMYMYIYIYIYICLVSRCGGWHSAASKRGRHESATSRTWVDMFCWKWGHGVAWNHQFFRFECGYLRHLCTGAVWKAIKAYNIYIYICYVFSFVLLSFWLLSLLSLIKASLTLAGRPRGAPPDGSVTSKLHGRR